MHSATCRHSMLWSFQCEPVLGIGALRTCRAARLWHEHGQKEEVGPIHQRSRSSCLQLCGRGLLVDRSWGGVPCSASYKGRSAFPLCQAHCSLERSVAQSRSGRGSWCALVRGSSFRAYESLKALTSTAPKVRSRSESESRQETEQSDGRTQRSVAFTSGFGEQRGWNLKGSLVRWEGRSWVRPAGVQDRADLGPFNPVDDSTVR